MLRQMVYGQIAIVEILLNFEIDIITLQRITGYSPMYVIFH